MARQRSLPVQQLCDPQCIMPRDILDLAAFSNYAVIYVAVARGKELQHELYRSSVELEALRLQVRFDARTCRANAINEPERRYPCRNDTGSREQSQLLPYHY